MESIRFMGKSLINKTIIITLKLFDNHTISHDYHEPIVNKLKIR